MANVLVFAKAHAGRERIVEMGNLESDFLRVVEEACARGWRSAGPEGLSRLPLRRARRFGLAEFSWNGTTRTPPDGL